MPDINSREGIASASAHQLADGLEVAKEYRSTDGGLAYLQALIARLSRIVAEQGREIESLKAKLAASDDCERGD